MPGIGDAFVVGLIVFLALIATRLGSMGDALGAFGRKISGRKTKEPTSVSPPDAGHFA